MFNLALNVLPLHLRVSSLLTIKFMYILQIYLTITQDLNMKVSDKTREHSSVGALPNPKITQPLAHRFSPT